MTGNQFLAACFGQDRAGDGAPSPLVLKQTGPRTRREMPGYLERGEFSPSLHLTLRIAAYFDVPVEVVFSLKPFKRLGE